MNKLVTVVAGMFFVLSACGPDETLKAPEESVATKAEPLSVNIMSSGGLSWYRDRSALRNTADAKSWAASATILSNKGWRLPTQVEAQALYAARATIGNWNDWINNFGNYIMTSTPYGGGTFGIRMSDGSAFVTSAGNIGFVALVKPAVVNIITSGSLTWYRDRSGLRNYAASVAYCAALLPSSQVGIGGGGWRLPTQAEATALVANRAQISNYGDWINSFGNYIVTSTRVSGGTFGIRLSDASTFTVSPYDVGFNACVH